MLPVVASQNCLDQLGIMNIMAITANKMKKTGKNPLIIPYPVTIPKMDYGCQPNLHVEYFFWSYSVIFSCVDY